MMVELTSHPLVDRRSCFYTFSSDLYHHINVKEDLSSWFSIFCLDLVTSKGYLLQVRLELTN